MAPVPFKIVQTDKLVVLVYEAFNLWRQVHLDNREFADDLNPSWLGYSKGRWEGDTLVVETRGLNGKQWLDHGGLPTSDKLTVIERFRRPNFGRLEIELTITDPTYYTKPWTVTTNARRMLGHRAVRVHLQREREVHASTWARTSSSRGSPTRSGGSEDPPSDIAATLATAGRGSTRACSLPRRNAGSDASHPPERTQACSRQEARDPRRGGLIL